MSTVVRRRSAVACTVLGLMGAVWSVAEVRLLPPSVTPRSLQIATAKTSVVVDAPRSALVDNRQDTYGIEALTDRAVVLGSVMANGSVRDEIARLAGVPAAALQIEAPPTPQQPRPPVERGQERRTADILNAGDEYRISIAVDPTVPVLDIFAQAPTPASAAALADAAVVASRAHLIELATAEMTPEPVRIELLQLGGARGEVLNEGVGRQVFLVAFFLTFVLSAAILAFLARVRRGWRLAALSERPAGA